MKNQNLINSKSFALSYWHSVETFGVEAVEKELNQPLWSKKYPDILQKIHSGDIKIRNQSVLPGEIVYEIAGRPECLYDFYESEDRKFLYAAFRDKLLTAPFDVSKAKAIKRQDALMLYGSYSLFKAADVGVGRKGE